MTNTILKKKTNFRNKFNFVLLITIVSLSTSCSHLFFDQIQPKGGDLQNEFPSKIQGDYSKWCYTNSEGKDICFDRDEIMTLDTLVFKKNAERADTNIIKALFIQFEAKTIKFESLSMNLDGTYELNKDIFLSKIDSFYVLNLKVDSKDYTTTSGKALKKELYECFAFKIDSSDNVQFFRITDDVLLKHKTAIIPKEGGSASHISKNQITKKNIIKILYYKPIPFILLYKAKGIVNGPQINEEAGVECEATVREYKKSLRTEKKALKKSN